MKGDKFNLQGFVNAFRTRAVVCKQTDTLETVPEYLCDSMIKPPAEEECNINACRVSSKLTWVKDYISANLSQRYLIKLKIIPPPIQPEWKIGEWSDCSSGDNASDSCPAISVRNVYCEQVW